MHYSMFPDTLSDYKKLTGGVFFVESIPKTEGGKIRRYELKNMAKRFYSKSADR